MVLSDSITITLEPDCLFYYRSLLIATVLFLLFTDILCVYGGS